MAADDRPPDGYGKELIVANQNTNSGIVVLGNVKGHSVIPLETPLGRLNYYDGKYLRAQDLNREQAYMRSLSALSNQAGGMGVVHGFDCRVINSQDQLEVGGGMAVDAAGRLIYLPSAVKVGIEDLLEKSRDQGSSRVTQSVDEHFSFQECKLKTGAEPGDIIHGDELYLIFIGSVEAFCGEEDVYGKLCEDACITSTERPSIIEGAVIKAVPLKLSSPLKQSSSVTLTSQHLRSLVASAYFTDEKNGDLISGEGIKNGPWCMGNRLPYNTADVPIALLVRNGKTTRFLDPWIPRRERMEAPARTWWARQMAMRPWNVFLAQILQFQCHLTSCFRESIGKTKVYDLCEEEHRIARKASDAMKSLLERYEEISASFSSEELKAAGVEPFFAKDLKDLQKDLADIGDTVVANRYLIDCGIVELPSAGYLPVSIGDAVTVNTQVRRMMGDGVDLQFCIVRPDFVAHALEEARHMDRISLVDPTDKPKIDVLVPNGRIKEQQAEYTGLAYVMNLEIRPLSFKILADILLSEGMDKNVTSMFNQQPEKILYGAARGEKLAAGGSAFYFAGLTKMSDKDGFMNSDARYTESSEAVNSSAPPSFLWIDMKTGRDPFELGTNDLAEVSAEIVWGIVFPETSAAVGIKFDGKFEIEDPMLIIERGKNVAGRLFGKIVFEFHAKAVTNEDPSPVVVKIDEKVLLLHRGESNGVSFSVFIRPVVNVLLKIFGRQQFEMVRDWTLHDEATVNASLTGTAPGKVETGLKRTDDKPLYEVAAGNALTKQDLFNAVQKIDKNVAKPEHPAHQASVVALNHIGKVVADIRFEHRASRKLFPPFRPSAEELMILPALDWVMFHRRREKTCREDIVPPAAVKLRTYRLYRVALTPEQDAGKLEASLADGQPVDDYKFDYITDVEFCPGIQAVQSSHDGISDTWDFKVGQDLEIVLAAIASQGTVIEEGAYLAKARLVSLTNIVGQTTEIAPNPNYLILEHVPDKIIAGEHDGVILLATEPKVETDCHEVFRAVVKVGTLEKLLGLIDSGESEDAVKVLEEQWPEPIGVLEFEKESAYLIEKTFDNVEEAWKAAGNSSITGVIAITEKTDDTDTEKDKAWKISKKLEGPEDVHVLSRSKILKDCPSGTILVTSHER